jgi:predicted dehydrogenase
MRFALLGLDTDTASWAAALAHSQQHSITYACDVAPQALAQLGLPAAIPHGNDWESLLTSQAADAVLVATSRDEDVRADQLRKLVQAGVPLLVAHPVHSSMLVYYELEMIHEEGRGPLMPLLFDRWHPAIVALFEQLSSPGPSGLGTLEQLSFVRSQHDRSSPAVKRAFARDVDLLRALGGEYNKIGAMGAGTGEQRFAHLGIQLSGPANVLARWNVEPIDAEAGGRLTLLASAGKAVLWMPEGSTNWQLTTTRQGQSQTQSYSYDSVAIGLEHFTRLCRGEETAPTWLDASRSVELADTIDRALDKGRTIELHQEDYTEEATFKGTMASVGCAILICGLLLFVLGAALAKMGVPGASYTPHLLLLIMAFFLGLQLLRLAFPAASNPPSVPAGSQAKDE